MANEVLDIKSRECEQSSCSVGSTTGTMSIGEITGTISTATFPYSDICQGCWDTSCPNHPSNNRLRRPCEHGFYPWPYDPYPWFPGHPWRITYHI